MSEAQPGDVILNGLARRKFVILTKPVSSYSSLWGNHNLTTEVAVENSRIVPVAKERIFESEIGHVCKGRKGGQWLRPLSVR